MRRDALLRAQVTEQVTGLLIVAAHAVMAVRVNCGVDSFAAAFVWQAARLGRLQSVAAQKYVLVRIDSPGIGLL